MDGWAVTAGATPGRLRVVGESAAGAPLRRGDSTHGAAVVDLDRRAAARGRGRRGAARAGRSGRCECSRSITRSHPGHACVGAARTCGPATSCCRRGLRIAAHHLAAAAGAGHPELRCDRRPRVALIVSGHELVPVGQDPEPGQVWDIQSVVMPALIRQAGAEVVLVGTVDDEPDATAAALSVALEAADLIVSYRRDLRRAARPLASGAERPRGRGAVLGSPHSSRGIRPGSVGSGRRGSWGCRATRLPASSASGYSAGSSSAAPTPG